MGRSIVLAAAIVASGAGLSATDWPQWRGVDRLAVWNETGIVDTLPDELQVTWRVPINSGFAGPAVAGGRVFITGWAEDPESRTIDGTERVLALDERTGAVLWTHEWRTSYRRLMFTYAIGPRATPTVDDDRVYVLGATGMLFCLDVETGAVQWQKNYAKDYGTSVPIWGMTSAPLVDGDRLIAVVGAEPDGMVLAFDKRTGEELWRSVEVAGEMGYSQPVIYEAGGVRQLIVWHATALVSLDPQTGELYWEQPWDTGSGMAIATPVAGGDYLLVSQLYNGSMMMRLNPDRPTATKLWQGQSRSPDAPDGLHTTISAPIIIGDYLYGLGVNGELRGLDARTGERVWEDLEMNAEARAEWGVVRWGTAFMVRHGDRYFMNSDEGNLIIARFTPEGYEEQSRTTLIEPTPPPASEQYGATTGSSTGLTPPTPTTTSCTATTTRSSAPPWRLKTTSSLIWRSPARSARRRQPGWGGPCHVPARKCSRAPNRTSAVASNTERGS